jgi:hypothetical protein
MIESQEMYTYRTRSDPEGYAWTGNVPALPVLLDKITKNSRGRTLIVLKTDHFEEDACRQIQGLIALQKDLVWVEFVQPDGIVIEDLPAGLNKIQTTHKGKATITLEVDGADEAAVEKVTILFPLMDENVLATFKPLIDDKP